ncbi:MAG: hypothetical protein ACO3B3_08680, partial [Cyanobium sp.]
WHFHICCIGPKRLFFEVPLRIASVAALTIFIVIIEMRSLQIIGTFKREALTNNLLYQISRSDSISTLDISKRDASLVCDQSHTTHRYLEAVRTSGGFLDSNPINNKFVYNEARSSGNKTMNIKGKLLASSLEARLSEYCLNQQKR